MVKFTRWLVYGVKHLLHAKFQQFTLYGFDAMTILVLTYFVDGFQPEAPLMVRKSHSAATDAMLTQQVLLSSKAFNV